MPLRDWIFGLFNSRPRRKDSRGRRRGPTTHVIILDGTMSSLARGLETNAGKTFKLLRDGGLREDLTVYYEAGIQWRDWGSTVDVMTGRGINRQIERAYGVLASRWRPGDRIVLIGYSRGAYAVRSLAGVIGNVGLVRSREATVRNIRQAYRHYRDGAQSEAAEEFNRLFCHPDVEIEAVAVWDTVKALGLRLPILWRWAQARHDFHDHSLGPHVHNGFHALALDETREAYAPVLWTTDPSWPGRMEQVWFNGTHGDVGGQIDGVVEARPLANIPLVWLLDRLELCGLPLPDGWRERFPQDPSAPSIGTWRRWGKLFLSRRRRIYGRDPSERLHPTVTRRVRGWPKPKTPKPADPSGAAGPDIFAEMSESR
ncbi:DUF2235 domain-containing protein [Flavimaricola marinus]|uniref:T6SS Phospholipase effector Tle1-like catalytic domain-containing protein n=1 Tax=Flavimaricola marinus TaxID=1819565 RepID=A0A238LHB6_9RHOB|nr:DUF2235 domain-containing protein [Flavimaricola marinus]SMY08972.1 hypothetical protein LOM8899_03132 [Flavimaricola marinus]